MMRPRVMKHVELTVLKSDINAVLEYMGRREIMHFTRTESGAEGEAVVKIRARLDRLLVSAEFLGLHLPPEPEAESVIPGEAEYAHAEKLCEKVEALKDQESAGMQEKRQIEEALNEAQAFSNLNAPFADLDQLSYLTLRLGRLDPRDQPSLKKNLGERAVLIPLDADGRRVLAASSRKGRFALDSELKKFSFEPIAIPEGYTGIPAELLESLERRLKNADINLNEIKLKKETLQTEAAAEFERLAGDFLVGLAVERLKTRLTSTSNIYMLSGWAPQDMIKSAVSDLSALTGGRVAIRAYNPEELSEVRDGTEKVPVSLKHGAFIKGFEGMVFSYGAPLYGTIDPTPVVAIFFTLLFGIMFGDFGQGCVLLLAGILVSKRGPHALSGLNGYSTPLISVGISSMVMGLLTGSVFTNERLLAGPTRAISAALTGHPVDRILVIMPLAEQGGSIRKLFLFFAFTIGMGVVLNSIGLLINISNRFVLKKYEAALFSKTGMAGLVFFWYALFIALRIIFGGSFQRFDLWGLLIPCFCIFFGPLLWRIMARKRPVLEHGALIFFMEGFVEILETLSSYIANTVSFLRVGAFALSHAVLSYIVFRFSEELVRWNSGPIGPLAALVLMLFGNLVIIVLEGMIVAIQVVRLQYYEFFSKFFTETGVLFSPFRFSKKR